MIIILSKVRSRDMIREVVMALRHNEKSLPSRERKILLLFQELRKVNRQKHKLIQQAQHVELAFDCVPIGLIYVLST